MRNVKNGSHIAILQFAYCRLTNRILLFFHRNVFLPHPEYVLRTFFLKKVAEAEDLCYPLFNKPNSWEHHNHYGVTYIPPLSLREEEELIWLFSYEYCSFYVNRTNWEKFLSFVIVSLYNDFTSFIVSFKIQTLSHCRVTFYYSTCPSPASD